MSCWTQQYAGPVCASSAYKAILLQISHSCSCPADVLLKLVQERGFEMFVHPIAPVLNETRHVVAPFNHKLQQQVIFQALAGLVKALSCVKSQ